MISGNARWRSGALTMLLVSAASFAYFSVGMIMLGRLTSAPPPTTLSLLARGVVAVVVGIALVMWEHRRTNPSVDSAIRDGLLIALLVVATNSLFGGGHPGLPLAIRTALVLVGLPLLAVLAHRLSRRSRYGTSTGAS